MRIRLFYEKRGFACFVPHVALSTLFARAAGRAGIELSSTEGFSRRAKISFGPELPAGVVALNEPVDLWTAGDVYWELEALNAQMPEGFRITKRLAVPDGSPALGKECGAAHYLVWTGNGLGAEELLPRMKDYYGEAFLSGSAEAEPGAPLRVSAVLAGPAQNGIGGWVKALSADGVISGWRDMRVVRVGLGRWNGEQMEPMNEAPIKCSGGSGGPARTAQRSSGLCPPEL